MSLKNKLPPATKRECARVRWTFICQDYTDEDEATLMYLFDTVCKYMIYSREYSSEHTPFLSGYFQLVTKQRETSLKKLVGDRIILRVGQGACDTTRLYCLDPSRCDNTVEMGKYEEQGKRKGMSRKYQTKTLKDDMMESLHQHKSPWELPDWDDKCRENFEEYKKNPHGDVGQYVNLFAASHTVLKEIEKYMAEHKTK